MQDLAHCILRAALREVEVPGALIQVVGRAEVGGTLRTPGAQQLLQLRRGGECAVRHQEVRADLRAHRRARLDQNGLGRAGAMDGDARELGHARSFTLRGEGQRHQAAGLMLLKPAVAAMDVNGRHKGAVSNSICNTWSDLT